MAFRLSLPQTKNHSFFSSFPPESYFPAPFTSLFFECSQIFLRYSPLEVIWRKTTEGSLDVLSTVSPLTLLPTLLLPLAGWLLESWVLRPGYAWGLNSLQRDQRAHLLDHRPRPWAPAQPWAHLNWKPCLSFTKTSWKLMCLYCLFWTSLGQTG